MQHRWRVQRTVCGALVAAFLALAGAVGDGRTQSPPAAADAARQRAQALDALFASLAKATSPDEAQALTVEIWRQWTQSGQPAVDLLMGQAAGAMAGRNYGLAVLLLDEIVDTAPLFAEGWNRRATLRFVMGEHERSLADIAKVLALEPRHFGALVGRGMIHTTASRWKDALTAYRAALAINPYIGEAKSIIPALEQKVEGEKL